MVIVYGQENPQVVDTPDEIPQWGHSGNYVWFLDEALPWVTRSGNYLVFDVDLATAFGVEIVRNGVHVEITQVEV